VTNVLSISRLEDCRVYELPEFADTRGVLTPIESNCHLPFDFSRVFYVYRLAAGASRGKHAQKQGKQFIICLVGGVDVELDDGLFKRTVRLDRPTMGLYVPQMIWTTQGNFTSDCVYLVLASGSYDKRDYVRNYEDFLRLVSAQSG